MPCWRSPDRSRCLRCRRPLLRLRYGPLVVAGALVLGGIVGGGALLRDRAATPAAEPTALVAAQPAALPTTAAAASSAAPQPTAAAISAPLPGVAASTAPQPTAAATSAPLPGVVASATPTSAPAPVASAAPASATAAPATTPTSGAAAPIANALPSATGVVSTVAPVVGYTGTFTPDRLVGAYRRDDGTLYGRQNAVLYSVGTGYETGTLSFSLVQAPTGPLTLILTGLDDEVSGTNRLVVTLNGVAIFAGADTFPNTPASDHGVGGADRYWGEMQLLIPAGVLRAGENTLVLNNVAPGGKLGTPYILINSVQFAAPTAK